MTEMIHVTEGEDIGNLLKTNFLNTRLLILAQEVWVYLINWNFIKG